MTSAKEKAYKLRHLILVVGTIFTLAGIMWAFLPWILSDFDDYAGLLGTPLIVNNLAVDSELIYGINVIIVIGVIFLLQWLFLRSGKNWKIRLTTEGRPLKTSIFAAGLMATLLTTGGITLLLELPDWWQPLQGDKNGGFYTYSIPIIWAVMLVIWAIWAWIFFIYWKQGDRYTQSGKMIRGLVAGSILEIIVAVPVHIWATRQRECYCCRGTYTTLILASTVLIWAFGPGIILLYMREKYRRGKLIEHETLPGEKPSEDNS